MDFDIIKVDFAGLSQLDGKQWESTAILYQLYVVVIPLRVYAGYNVSIV